MFRQLWIVIEQGKQGTFADRLSSKEEAIEQATERAGKKPGETFEIFEKVSEVRLPINAVIVDDVADQQPRRHSPPPPPRYRDGHLDKGITFRELIFEILRTNKGPMLKRDVRARFLKWPWEGRSGYRYSPNTFQAEFGKMVKEGLIIVDRDGFVMMPSERRVYGHPDQQPSH
jgi:hypothetical protein